MRWTVVISNEMQLLFLYDGYGYKVNAQMATSVLMTAFVATRYHIIYVQLLFDIASEIGTSFEYIQ